MELRKQQSKDSEGARTGALHETEAEISRTSTLLHMVSAMQSVFSETERARGDALQIKLLGDRNRRAGRASFGGDKAKQDKERRSVR